MLRALQGDVWSGVSVPATGSGCAVGAHPNLRITAPQGILKILGRRFCSMAKLVYGLMQSLDGYVDHLKMGTPLPATGRHFLELVRNQSGLVYGRGTYEIMRYWDEDRSDWDAEDH